MRRARLGVYAGLLLILCSIAAGLSISWFQETARERRNQDDRKAGGAARLLYNAETVFRDTDADANGIRDFWTGDVSGLYGLIVGGKRIELIPRELAEADVHPLHPLVPTPIPYHGHYVVALDADESVADPKEKVYRQDTGGSSPMGRVHHEKRFGFVLYPAERGRPGHYSWIVNEEGKPLRCSYDTPIPQAYPTDADLKKSWAIID